MATSLKRTEQPSRTNAYISTFFTTIAYIRTFSTTNTST